MTTAIYCYTLFIRKGGSEIEYYYQSSGVYSATPTSSVTRKGTTDTVASVTDEDKTSTKTDLLYVFDISASNILKGNIEADGSLILKVNLMKMQ